MKSISESNKVAKLKTDGARLLYTWLLTHLDINGCFSGNALVVQRKVFTRLSHSTQTVENYLQDLERMDLIIRYDADGDTFLYIPDFVDKQPSLNPDREATPSIPMPTPEQIQSKSGCTQLQVKESKVKQSKDMSIIKEFMEYYNSKLKERGWIKQNLQLTYARNRLIEDRTKHYSLDDLKKCVDNFVRDEWEDRHKYIDPKYCIGIIGGRDLLERWLNADLKPKKEKDSWDIAKERTQQLLKKDKQ